MKGGKIVSGIIRQDWMSDEVYEWACLEEQARLNTLLREMGKGSKALIAIKAQHPLNADGTPGLEYKKRLEKALEVKAELEARGLEVRMMTFGGVHEGHQTMTLAEAGAAWLQKHDVPESAIIMQPMVFSGNDEDRLAAECFANDGNFRELHVVMSAGQFERARLYFIYQGWQPTIHPVTFLAAKPNHSTVCELWGPWAVPSFEKGPEAIAEATEKIRKQHIEATMQKK
ncbi:YdcF family protein [Candidatus Saccharibacteria bacterium]|nr:YdcF family protein [Candidatus Saccharibacteria bacterium]